MTMKKMTKKATALCLALWMLLTVFTACSTPQDDNTDSQPPSTPNTQQTTYQRVNKDGVESEIGTYMLFGSYPQSAVTDPELQATLSGLAGTLPTSESYSSVWKSYNYYREQSQMPYMWYQDITLNGETYRGVYFVEYRPTLSHYGSDTDHSVQDDNGYARNTLYWFKFEPIQWKILKEGCGSALLLCEDLIDSQPYQAAITLDGTTNHYAMADNGVVTDSNGKQVYANNYEYSTIRTWLNKTFYDTAFSAVQQGMIRTTNVENGTQSVTLEENPYVSNNTQDKIFLLSDQEIADYGFNHSTDRDEKRAKTATAYAKIQGASIFLDSQSKGDGRWWLRSPHYEYDPNDAKIAHTVSSYGLVSGTYSVDNTATGVCPALWVKFEEKEHTWIAATCTAPKTCEICHATEGVPLSHDWAEATCIEPKTCKLCGIVQGMELGHTYQGTACARCGAPREATYVRVDENGNSSATGKYLLFGSYPQSEVTDRALTATLNRITGNTLPTEEAPAGWTSYQYYGGDTPSDYMWYRDVTYGGQRYRGVYFDSYRPSLSKFYHSGVYQYQKDNGYQVNTVYWFRYDPIKWRILTSVGGESLILCDMLIDAQEYNPTTDGVGTQYANNYANSQIRLWLNNQFYNTAFDELQKELIVRTGVDNSSATNRYPNRENQFACGDTYDYVFLLSYQDSLNTAYGFVNNGSLSMTDTDPAKQKEFTDYAKAQGGAYSDPESYIGELYPNTSSWWLRSPSDSSGSKAWTVSPNGLPNSTPDIFQTGYGVCPALWVKL